MLYDLDGNRVTHIPHRKEFDTWRANISDADYDNAVEAIREHIENESVFTSSFIPGSDWTDTPYQPLFIACGQSETQSALFFGLIVWCVMMADDDEWLFKPSEKEDGDPLGMTYWRRNRP